MINYIKNWWKDYNKLKTRIRLCEELEDGVVVGSLYLSEYKVGMKWKYICPSQTPHFLGVNSEERARKVIDYFLSKHNTIHQTRNTIIKYPVGDGQ